VHDASLRNAASGKASTESVVVGGSAISRQLSAISCQLSAISHPPSALKHQSRELNAEKLTAEG
jgi:hypothetical protein